MQMFAVAAMAVFVHNAIGDGSKGFALSYAAFLLILTYMWWRTGVHDPDHRPLSQPWSVVSLISVLLFALSVFADTPLRYYLWGIALLLSLLLPLLMNYVSRNNPQARAQHEMASSFSPAAVERFGLFTIIVLGEVIVGVVQGVVGIHDLNWTVGATAGLGMLIAIGAWWIYFDYISHRLPLTKPITNYVWGYLHLPMTIGIAATGAAVLNVVEHSGEPLPDEGRWLLVASVSIALISIAFLMRTIQIPDEHQRIFYTGSRITLTCAIIVPVLGFSGLGTIPLLIVLIALMLTPVFYGLKAWIRSLGTVDI
jgi:low temperature requirement protein LtrA